MPKTIVVMAVYHPNPKFLLKQFKSLGAQSDSDFAIIAVVADLVSHDAVETAGECLADRITLVTPSEKLTPPSAFEFGLNEALAQYPDASYFALCDQDDIWNKHRIANTVTALSLWRVDMVHSDAQVVDSDGQMIARSLFRSERRQRRPRVRDLLYRNSVTGMTTLCTRELIERALPFPPQDGTHYYHDLWLALLARSGWGLKFIPQTLVKYRQHGGNVIGAMPARQRSNIFAQRLKQRAAAYGLARYLAEAALNRSAGHRDLHPFQQAKSLGGVFVMDACRLLCRGQPRMAATALWFGAVSLGRKFWSIRRAISPGYAHAKGEFDNRLFAASPGAHPPQATAPHPPTPASSWWTFFDARMDFKWRVGLDAPRPAMQILLPSLNPNEMFAGLATAIDIGLGLAHRGLPVRFIATDLPIANRAATRQFIQGRSSQPLAPADFEIHCGVTTRHIEAHPDDQIMATAWWTAHIANKLVGLSQLNATRFHYLIQDFEPCFYPWGTEYASAATTYSFDHIPIYNSAPLRDYFISMGLAPPGPHHCFHPSIDLQKYQLDRPRKPKKTVAFYGRPEVARNMFEMGIAALGHWIEADNITPDEVELVSVGLKHQDIELPNNMVLRSLGKIPWADYPKFLAGVDLGLALMCSPHPSHLPIELAAAGARVVTNGFATKDLSQLSPLITSVPLDEAQIVNALRVSWAKPGDREAIDLTKLGAPLSDVLDDMMGQPAMRTRPIAA